MAILTAVAAFAVRDGSKLDIPADARPYLWIGLGLLGAAALLALATNAPLGYRGPSTAALRGAVRGRWDDSEARALKKIALTELDLLQTARKRNNLKAILLFIALFAEASALVALGLAIYFSA